MEPDFRVQEIQTENGSPEANQPFYYEIDFWISTILGLAGLIVTVLAFVEAKSAKNAAREAATQVKTQMTTIELTIVGEAIRKIDPNISFTDARNLLNDISAKLGRVTSPYEKDKDSDLQQAISKLKTTLDETRKALNSVRPIDSQAERDTGYAHSVYHATEEHFSKISTCVAELTGLFEQKTM